MEKIYFDKRGTHVGLMLSFLIFIIFLIFLYTIIEPQIQSNGNKKAILDYIKYKMIENITAEVTITSIKVNKSAMPSGEDCFEIKQVIGGEKFVVKNETNKDVNASKRGNDILEIKSNSSKEEFFRVYYSNIFEKEEDNLNNCWKPEPKDYWIGLTKNVEYAFEKEIISLKNAHQDNYEGLKKDLNIPLGTEFSFSFTYENGSIIKTAEKEVETDIYAEEIPLQYINERADMGYGFLNIKVW